MMINNSDLTKCINKYNFQKGIDSYLIKYMPHVINNYQLMWNTIQRSSKTQNLLNRHILNAPDVSEGRITRLRGRSKHMTIVQTFQ